MSFTSNTRDEVTLIFLKHKYRMNVALLDDDLDYDTVVQVTAENHAIRETFYEVRERNAKNLQAGSYEAIGTICDEFFAAADLVER